MAGMLERFSPFKKKKPQVVAKAAPEKPKTDLSVKGAITTIVENRKRRQKMLDEL